MQVLDINSDLKRRLNQSGITILMKSIESCDWVVIEENEDKIIGAAGLGGLFHVSGIQILENHIGKGIGKKIQAELINESKRRGYSFIMVFNDPRNTPSSKLHDSLGYQTIFRIHYSEDIVNDVKAIILKKPGRLIVNFLKIFNTKTGMLFLGIILKLLKFAFPRLIIYNEDNLKSPDIGCMLRKFEKI